MVKIAGRGLSCRRLKVRGEERAPPGRVGTGVRASSQRSWRRCGDSLSPGWNAASGRSLSRTPGRFSTAPTSLRWRPGRRTRACPAGQRIQCLRTNNTTSTMTAMRI